MPTRPNLGEFPGEDRVQHAAVWHPDPVERFRLQREHWLRWLQKNHPHAFGRLEYLVKKGCDEDRLVFYLYYLKFCDKAVRLSREEFEKLIKRLDQAVEDLEFLTTSALGFGLDESDGEFPHELDELLCRVSSFEDWVGRKGNALLDDACAAIVRHVDQETGSPHHLEVSTLIAAALEGGKSKRKKKGKKKGTGKKKDTYTLDAHKQWAYRDSLEKQLLEQETHHERQWLELKKLIDQHKPASPEG